MIQLSTKYQNLALLLCGWMLAGYPFIAQFKGGSSLVFGLLLLAALIGGWNGFSSLPRQLRFFLYGVLLFVVIIISSIIQSHETYIAFKNFESYLHLAALALIIPLLVRVQPNIQQYWIGLLAVSLFATAVLSGYAYFFMGSNRGSFAYHHIIEGDTAALLIAITAVYLYTIRPAVIWQIVLLLAISAATGSMIFSGVRGAWLAILLLPFVWISILYGRSAFKYYLIASVFVVAVALIAYATLSKIETEIDKGVNNLVEFYENPQQVMNPFNDALWESSWGQRLHLWYNSYFMWRDNPVFGTGIGDFAYENKQLILQHRSHGVVEQYGHAHSIYIGKLATNGVVGMVIMVLALFILPWRYLAPYSHNRDVWLRFYAIAAMTTLACFAIFGLSEDWLGRNPMVNHYVIWLSIFISGIVIREGQVNNSSIKQSENIRL